MTTLRPEAKTVLGLVVNRGPLDLIDINRFAKTEGFSGREVSMAVQELARRNAIRKVGIEWHITRHGEKLANGEHDLGSDHGRR